MDSMESLRLWLLRKVVSKRALKSEPGRSRDASALTAPIMCTTADPPAWVAVMKLHEGHVFHSSCGYLWASYTSA